MRLPSIIYKTYNTINGKKLTRIRKYPVVVDVGLTNLCDLNCEMCVNDKIDKKRGFMSEDMFRSIVDVVQRKFNNKTIMGLGLFGESLLHPKFINFLEYATSKKIKMRIATNCLKLSQEASEAIINSSIELMEISLYTLDKSNYTKIVGGDRYDAVIKNVHAFLALAEKNRYKGKIRLRPLENNKEEMTNYEQEFYSKYSNLNFDRKRPKELGNWAGFLNFPIKNIFVYKVCQMPFSRLVIDWDGEVRLCCESMLAKDLSVGHIGLQYDLNDIWHSQEFNAIRERFSRLDYSLFPSCQNCPRIIWNFSISKAWQALKRIVNSHETSKRK